MATKHASPPVPPDEAPDQTPFEEPVPEEEPEERLPPADASSLGCTAAEGEEPEPSWKEGYRSAMDNPRHPLHHLRGV